MSKYRPLMLWYMLTFFIFSVLGFNLPAALWVLPAAAYLIGYAMSVAILMWSKFF